jgi:primosomal protein N' (replication factor Y)
MTTGFGQVAVPLPVAQPYTYQIPETLADRATPGSRVVVPVRGRELIGVLMEAEAPAPPPDVTPRPILSVLDIEPAFPGPLLETARWVAGYYGAPIGITLKAMLPAGLWGASRVMVEARRPDLVPGGLGGDILAWLDRKGAPVTASAVAKAFRRSPWDVLNRLARVGAVTLTVTPAEPRTAAGSERVVALVGERLTLVQREQTFGRARAQSRLYDALDGLGGVSATRHVEEQLGFSPAVIRGLVQRGLARVEKAERLRDPFAQEAGTPPPSQLTSAQQAAVSAITGSEPDVGTLLFGVTGSGKTLVYLEAIRLALARGEGAVILVPEIGLTPQTVGRLRGAFGDQVAVLHSGLSEAERADAWRALRRGERRVAVGPRSAIFAPVTRLGVIVLDEEHEASYKNGEAPRYHARDVGAVRARLERARLVLGSATPSPESMSRVGGQLQMVRLPERIGARPLPAVEVVDLRHAKMAEGSGAVPWSEAMEAAVIGALARREQVILLLNRRGFAAFLQCPQCGDVPQCPRCSISLTVHETPPPGRLRCHYCGHEAPLARNCASCGHPAEWMRGVGTQRVERMLAERFPAARLARMDLDTTSTRWSHQRILGAMARHEIDLLVGTQMIAKGLDFPEVTLVGVVDADTSLYLPDFRAAERTFQLLAQVAGRAGRGPLGGKVIVQTRRPEHHAIRRAAAHDVEGFLADEMALRSSPPYPPLTALANIVVSGLVEPDVSREAARVADWCTGLIERHALPLTLLGPAPCPIARVQGRWRWHLILKGPSAAIGRLVRYAPGRLEGAGKTRVVIDRDPVALL